MAMQEQTRAQALDWRLRRRQFVNTAAQSSHRMPNRSASKLKSRCRHATSEVMTTTLNLSAAKHTGSRRLVRSEFFPRQLSVDPAFDEGCLHEDRCSYRKAKTSGPAPVPPKLLERALARAIPGMRGADRILPRLNARIFLTWTQNVLPNPVPNHLI